MITSLGHSVISSEVYGHLVMYGIWICEGMAFGRRVGMHEQQRHGKEKVQIKAKMGNGQVHAGPAPTATCDAGMGDD